MRPKAEVLVALEGTAALLIVNAPRECVVGGNKPDVRRVIEKLEEQVKQTAKTRAGR